MLSMRRVSCEVWVSERRSRSRAFDVNGYSGLLACRLKCAAKLGDDQERVSASQQADDDFRQEQRPYRFGDLRRLPD